MDSGAIWCNTVSGTLFVPNAMIVVVGFVIGQQVGASCWRQAAGQTQAKTPGCQISSLSPCMGGVSLFGGVGGRCNNEPGTISSHGRVGAASPTFRER